MAEHNELGKAGEEAAVRFLESKGYLIRERNWRYKHLELDIIASKDNELIVIEVKARQSTDFAMPTAAVDWKKIRHIVRATDVYVKLCRIDCPVRFDIITLVGQAGNFAIEHLEEAFYPPLM